MSSFRKMLLQVMGLFFLLALFPITQLQAKSVPEASASLSSVAMAQSVVYLFVADSAAGNIYAFDTRYNDAVYVKKISVGGSPSDLVVYHNYLLIANSQQSSLQVVNLSSLNVTGSISLPKLPYRLELDGDRLWVTVSRSDSSPFEPFYIDLNNSDILHSAIGTPTWPAGVPYYPGFAGNDDIVIDHVNHIAYTGNKGYSPDNIGKFDISNPSAPQFLLVSYHGLYGANGKQFVLNSTGSKLYIAAGGAPTGYPLQVAKTSDLSKDSELTLGAYPNAVDLNSGYIFAGKYFGNEDVIYVYSETNQQLVHTFSISSGETLRDRGILAGFAVTNKSLYKIDPSGGTIEKKFDFVNETSDQSYQLDVTVNGAGSVVFSPGGTACGIDCMNYTKGTQVTLTAKANTGYKFDGWTGGCSGTSSTCLVTVNADMNVTATFSQIQAESVYFSDIKFIAYDSYADISWTTSIPLSSKIIYGFNPDVINGEVSNSALTTAHSMRIENLQSSKTYYYSLEGVDASGQNHYLPDYYTFTTIESALGPGVSILQANISNVDDHSALISWKTETACRGQVTYWNDAHPDQKLSRSEASKVTSHLLSIDGLLSNTKYWYEIICLDVNSGSVGAWFFTARDNSSDSSVQQPAENTMDGLSEQQSDTEESSSSDLRQTVLERERDLTVVVDQELTDRLKGHILLQVQEAGEAWYITPEDGIRYYLGRPNDAFDIMREQGVGITNADLSRIRIHSGGMQGNDSDGDGLSDLFEDAIGTDKQNPDSDGDGFNDKTEVENGYNPLGSGRTSTDQNFACALAGKIFLQVENNGEAWYVNPDDCTRYFLGRPADAFTVMRGVGLGITNTDIRRIQVES